MEHEILSWNTFILVSNMRMFLIYKKIVLTEKRYCVKFDSIKKSL